MTPFITLKKVAKAPVVHLSFVLTGMLFLNYVADLEVIDKEVTNEEQSKYFKYQLEEILSKDISDILKF